MRSRGSLGLVVLVLPWYPFHLSRLAFRFLLPSRFAFGGSCIPLLFGSLGVGPLLPAFVCRFSASSSFFSLFCSSVSCVSLLSRFPCRFLLLSRVAFGGSCLPLCSVPLVWAPCSLLLFVVSPPPRRFSRSFFRLSRASRSSLGFRVFRVSFPCRDALKTPLSCPLLPRFSPVSLCFPFWSCVGLFRLFGSLGL